MVQTIVLDHVQEIVLPTRAEYSLIRSLLLGRLLLANFRNPKWAYVILLPGTARKDAIIDTQDNNGALECEKTSWRRGQGTRVTSSASARLDSASSLCHMETSMIQTLDFIINLTLFQGKRYVMEHDHGVLPGVELLHCARLPNHPTTVLSTTTNIELEFSPCTYLNP
eukprot:6466745-Amphidinium_carterae.1